MSALSRHRKPIACQRCHRKKVKCTGEIPCRHCRSTASDCVYPTRNRNVTVSEAYLEALESAVKIQKESGSANNLMPSSSQQGLYDHHTRHHRSGVQRTPSSSSLPQPPRTRFTENNTAEAFVSKLKRLGTSDDSLWWQGILSEPSLYASVDQGPVVEDEIPRYEYFPLPSDRLLSKITLNLPPYPYANHLVDQFEAYMGFEYHWYLRKSFRERLESTYRNPQTEQSKDGTWLCRLLIVLALGETYDGRQAPSIELNGDADSQNSTHSEQASTPASRFPPGVQFFDQAMSIFKIPCEEATIDHVEALNLIAFYSYSLDRRKSAYVYAGLAMRISCGLMLHRASHSGSSSAVDYEHRRRIWWTTYQIDSMTGSEIGMNSSFDFEEMELGLPTEVHLSPEEREEFTHSTIFNAHIHLCSVRAGILSVAGRLRETDFQASMDDILRRSMEQLEDWRSKLSERINFDFSQGLPQKMVEMPELRSLASLFLRFHQCFVLLLRPVLLRLLTLIISIAPSETQSANLVYMSNRCLEAARFNLNIFTGLWKVDRIAKFGFWESLHLFSSIKILLMASIVNTVQPLTLEYRVEDDRLYRNANLLLQEMASAGNIASKGHMSLLNDVERVRELVVERFLGPANIPEAEVDIYQLMGVFDGLE